MRVERNVKVTNGPGCPPAHATSKSSHFFDATVHSARQRRAPPPRQRPRIGVCLRAGGISLSCAIPAASRTEMKIAVCCLSLKKHVCGLCKCTAVHERVRGTFGHFQASQTLETHTSTTLTYSISPAPATACMQQSRQVWPVGPAGCGAQSPKTEVLFQIRKGGVCMYVCITFQKQRVPNWATLQHVWRSASSHTPSIGSHFLAHWTLEARLRVIHSEWGHCLVDRWEYGGLECAGIQLSPQESTAEKMATWKCYGRFGTRAMSG